MSVERCTMWRTADGKIFPDQNEAERHELAVHVKSLLTADNFADETTVWAVACWIAAHGDELRRMTAYPILAADTVADYLKRQDPDLSEAPAEGEAVAG